jgi:acetolactate synthase-1/2/3 large subunit
MKDNVTVADCLADALARRGVRRMFGVPGGGSLDLIEAAAARNVEFVLARTETAAAIMAATTAELTGAPGVVITGLGPGAASVVNGAAYALLDRAPLVVVTDAIPGAQDFVTHQALDQRALLAPVAKAHLRLSPGTLHGLDDHLDLALAAPAGSVHIDLSGDDAARPAPGPFAGKEPSAAAGRLFPISSAAALIAGAKRPVIIAGLEARDSAAAAALVRLAHKLECPVFATYKAKGVFPEDDPLSVGMFTGGAAEAACIGQADLVIFYGVDPIELIPQKWRYRAPILEFSLFPSHRQYAEPAERMTGPLATATELVLDVPCQPQWQRAEIAAFRREMRAALASPQGAPITPQALVEAVQAAAPRNARATVDAGAHMIPATAFWHARKPNDVLISNGLSTMGFALPAAIASALAEPLRPVAALTGDGGLSMCLGEIATAAERRLPVITVVFNDAALSLIDIKQQAQKLPTRGVRYPTLDFARVAEGLGARGYTVRAAEELGPALAAAFVGRGPAVVDVAVDASGYPAQLKALRG